MRLHFPNKFVPVKKLETKNFWKSFQQNDYNIFQQNFNDNDECHDDKNDDRFMVSIMMVTKLENKNFTKTLNIFFPFLYL